MRKSSNSPLWPLAVRLVIFASLAFTLWLISAALFVSPGVDNFEYRGVQGRSLHTRSARRPSPLELYVAARAGDVGEVRALLSRGAKVDAATSTGEQALHAAASGGFTEIVVLLLGTEGVFPSDETVFGVTPLLLAATKGHGDIVTLLLSAGANVHTVTTYDKATPFMRAARARHEGIVQSLLGAGSAPDARDVDGRTALTYAAEEGAVSIVRLLLSAKADVDAFQLSNGMTPLMFAANSGNTELVELLTSNGAGVNLTSTWDKMTPLHRAASGSHVAVVKQLLAMGSVVDSPSMGSGQDGLTPLMLAARAGSADVCKLLIEAGANPAAKDGWKADKVSVLDYAAQTGSQELVDFLKSKGAV